MSKKKCEKGCNLFYGSEVQHHQTCVFYPDSLSEIRDKQAKQIERLKSVLPKLEMESTERTLTVAKLEGEVKGIQKNVEKLKSLFGEILAEICSYQTYEFAEPLNFSQIQDIFTAKLKEVGIELEETK